MKGLAIVGIDLAKSSFQLHGATKTGKCLFRKKLTREKLLVFVANIPQREKTITYQDGHTTFMKKKDTTRQPLRLRIKTPELSGHCVPKETPLSWPLNFFAKFE